MTPFGKNLGCLLSECEILGWLNRDSYVQYKDNESIEQPIFGFSLVITCYHIVSTAGERRAWP
jgi:hypothetical protein